MFMLMMLKSTIWRDGRMKNRNQEHSNNWKTPINIRKWILKNYGPYFDPCPYMSNFDGLKIEWKELNYVNPGYDLKTKTDFVIKSIEQAKKQKICLVLIPFTPETKLFHDYIYPEATKIFIPPFRPQFAGFNTKGKYVTNQSGQSAIVLIEFDYFNFYIRNGKMPVFEIWDLEK